MSTHNKVRPIPTFPYPDLEATDPFFNQNGLPTLAQPLTNVTNAELCDPLLFLVPDKDKKVGIYLFGR